MAYITNTIKNVTNTNIEINDASTIPIYNLKMTKESTQDGEPSPDNPVEVKTVKGYENLLHRRKQQ